MAAVGVSWKIYRDKRADRPRLHQPDVRLSLGIQYFLPGRVSVERPVLRIKAVNYGAKPVYLEEAGVHLTDGVSGFSKPVPCCDPKTTQSFRLEPDGAAYEAFVDLLDLKQANLISQIDYAWMRDTMGRQYKADPASLRQLLDSINILGDQPP